MRRAGWAIAQVDSAGVLFKAAYGPVPADFAPTQDPEVAEDYAVFMASQLCREPFSIHIDCASTLGRINKPTYNHRSQHLWGKIWTSWEAGQVTAHKVKAHTTMTDVDNGAIAWDVREGNGEADRLAKLGARMHPFADNLAQAITGIFRMQRRILIWAAVQEAAMQDLPALDCPTLFEDKAPQLPPKSSLYNARLAGPVPAWSKLANIEAMQASAPMSHSLLLASLGPQQPGILLCSRCGAFAHKTVRDLKTYCDPSKNKAARSYRMRRFYAGIYPGYDRDDAISRPHRPTPGTIAWLLGRSTQRGRDKNPTANAFHKLAGADALASLGLTFAAAVREGTEPEAEWEEPTEIT